MCYLMNGMDLAFQMREYIVKVTWILTSTSLLLESQCISLILRNIVASKWRNTVLLYFEQRKDKSGVRQE